MGSPPPSPLASVSTSGRTPSAWWANQVPVRPMPLWISSTHQQRAGLVAGLPRGAQVALGRRAPRRPRPGRARGRRPRCRARPRPAARRRRRTARTAPSGRTGRTARGWTPCRSAPARPWSGRGSRSRRPPSPGAPGPGAADQLDRRLVGLGARVGEEDPPGLAAPSEDPEQRARPARPRPRAGTGWRCGRPAATWR